TPAINLLVAVTTCCTNLDIASCAQGNQTPTIDLARYGYRSMVANQRHRALMKRITLIDLTLNKDIAIFSNINFLTKNIAVCEHGYLLLSLTFLRKSHGRRNELSLRLKWLDIPVQCSRVRFLRGEIELCESRSPGPLPSSCTSPSLLLL